VKAAAVPNLGIYRADPHDQDAVTATLVDAFHGGDLAPWLIPDPDERRRLYPAYLGMFADFFLHHGYVDATEDLAAVALWMSVDQRIHLDIPNYGERLERIVGPALGRFLLLDTATDVHHPRGRPHEYLAYLAVLPHCQGQGLGGALLRHRLATIDKANRAAYLEATGADTVRLYQRHGFTTLYQAPIPAGPSLFPMWRPPASGRRRS
jgi:ribosomal protein S18 acetylase RimI-like enzyme